MDLFGTLNLNNYTLNRLSKLIIENILAKGVNVKVISERLGHSNIKITLDTYSHVLLTMQEDAVNKIEEIL